MPLQVFTARISTADPDKLDVTRKSAGPEGIVFAPSAALLDRGKHRLVTWEEYARLYTAEMRVSFRQDERAWFDLLARERVVFACYCVDPLACHRSVLADIFGKLGADVRGELGLAEAVAAVRAAIAAEGKLTPRSLSVAVDDAGAELCVVWSAMLREKIVSEPYEEAKARGLLGAIRRAREERERAT